MVICIPSTSLIRDCPSEYHSIDVDDGVPFPVGGILIGGVYFAFISMLSVEQRKQAVLRIAAAYNDLTGSFSPGSNHALRRSPRFLAVVRCLCLNYDQS